MEFWSKGLGRRSLVLDLGRETVEADCDQVALAGNVTAPVSWRYIMYLGEGDWTEFFELALRGEMASYLLSRGRLGALARLTGFLFRFVALYVVMLARVRLGLAVSPSRVTVTPDFRARSQIDPAALAEMGGSGASSTRRPRPRRPAELSDDVAAFPSPRGSG